MPARIKYTVILIIVALLAIGAIFLFKNKNQLVVTSDSIKVTNDGSDIKTNTLTGRDEPVEVIEDSPEPKQVISEANSLKSTVKNKKPSDKDVFNLLVLGIDRRFGEQKSWRTDVIQLITISADRTKTVVTHIPRDVWAGSYKINSIYNLKGPEALKDEIEKITNQRPDRIIRIDFDAFAWAIDSVGGLTINVPVAFTDKTYPNDRKGQGEAITISFKKGIQTMDGETALTYVRSRKGDNGQGSDYARGTRQQIVMQEIIDDYFKEGNLFKPKTALTLFNIATQKVYTDLTVEDTTVLYEVLKNYKTIKVTNLSLDTSNYLEVPKNSAEYGGAWTLIGKGGTYQPIHEAILKGME